MNDAYKGSFIDDDLDFLQGSVESYVFFGQSAPVGKIILVLLDIVISFVGQVGQLMDGLHIIIKTFLLEG